MKLADDVLQFGYLTIFLVDRFVQLAASSLAFGEKSVHFLYFDVFLSQLLFDFFRFAL